MSEPEEVRKAGEILHKRQNKFYRISGIRYLTMLCLVLFCAYKWQDGPEAWNWESGCAGLVAFWVFYGACSQIDRICKKGDEPYLKVREDYYKGLTQAREQGKDAEDLMF
ncbi:hypothetical protein OAK38_06130 [Verrucomicrobia bacterium]|nr:hypothetical protein [Verrucomicrobiota bacterium]